MKRLQTVWLVCPVYRRFELTEITFAEYRWCLKEIEKFGYRGQCVVVGNDVNVERAAEAKFHTVLRNNKWLGRKFSDGIEYAYRHNADYIVPIGSDNWIHPDYFENLSGFRSGNYYTVISPYAEERLECWIEYKNMEVAVGPYVIPRKLLERNPRPCPDEKTRGCDSGTIAGIKRANGYHPIHEKLDVEFHNVHPAQYTTFRGAQQVTTYSYLKQQWGENSCYTENVFAPLYELYPSELIERVEQIYAAKQEHLTNP